ncbi:hypothetical protein [Rodentibacter pneumotropicus]|uniref:hypothetical protein n=1 Tax=Rodentibacter pneumotropicus TaxID=758 RepID=UPI001863E8B2|nr:hypothetical protein [Rodentibacter pneumotropicus]
MKNLANMTDLMQRIDQLKLTAIEEQQTLAKSLNERITKSGNRHRVTRIRGY